MRKVDLTLGVGGSSMGEARAFGFGGVDMVWLSASRVVARGKMSWEGSLVGINNVEHYSCLSLIHQTWL